MRKGKDPLAEIDTLNAANSPEAVLEEFNGLFFVVNENGKAVIYSPKEDSILKRSYHDRMGFGDLRQLYLNRCLNVGKDKKGNPVTAPVAEWWLRHPQRRQFVHGVTFDPSGRKTPGVLNLWQGFAVKPKPGSWALLREHIRLVICAGKDERFSYLLCWMARMVQHPAEQGEVAIVMRGGEGTGKGTLARALKRILGQHALSISHAKHLTGNFNAHLRDCVFLFADEAFYAGDKQHVGVLNAIITEPHITIEGKYQNATQTPNYLHLMMASNEDWVIPASLGARRFCMLEVTSDHKDDHAYFAAIWKQMENGGYEAMLHELLSIDLGDFNVRCPPATDALDQQKKLSLPVPEMWWKDCLHRGFVFQSRLGLEHWFGEWHAILSTDLLYASYIAFAAQKRDRHPMDREAFGRFMVRMGCRATRRRHLVVGEHIAIFEDGGRKPQAVRKDGLTYGYDLGILDGARVDLSKRPISRSTGRRIRRTNRSMILTSANLPTSGNRRPRRNT